MSQQISSLKEELSDVIDEINFIKDSSTHKNMEIIDELTKNKFY